MAEIANLNRHDADVGRIEADRVAGFIGFQPRHRLTWTRTFDDVRNDVEARSPEGGSVGRIYRINGGPGDGQWFWC
jgi:hypothetical protein